MFHSVVEEGCPRKLLVLGKARPKQSFGGIFFPIPVSSFLLVASLLWKSRLLGYSAWERPPSLPVFRENSDSAWGGLGDGAVGWVIWLSS